MDTQKKQQASKSQYGTLTAKFDANNDYGSSTNTKNSTTTSAKQQESKSKYGTLTAKSDANNEYK